MSRFSSPLRGESNEGRSIALDIAETRNQNVTKGSSHPEHAAVLVLPFDPFGIRLVNEGSFRRNDPSGRSFTPRKTRTQSVWTDIPMARMFSVGCGEKAEYRAPPPRKQTVS